MTNDQTKELKIAVTGHRHIPDDIQLYQSIKRVFETLIRSHPDRTFTLLSPLAEGSDQLAARTALASKAFKLQVSLPMPVDEYLQDFISEDGQVAFHQLLAMADEVHPLPHQENHQEAYRSLGQYLVNNSDMLLAIWNGDHTEKIGGTSDVVRIASAAKKPIHWVYCPNQKPEAVNPLEEQKQIGDLESLIPDVWDTGK